MGRKAGIRPSHPLIIEDDPYEVYEVDPLRCPTCGGQMSILSFIEEPKTIDRIISHLELTFEAERPPPPRVVQQDLLMAAEESGEYL